MPTRSDEEHRARFRSMPRNENGCWLWTGPVMTSGYGYTSYRGRKEGAHRLSYRLFVGDIGLGLQTDHLCQIKLCVNPEHLEIVTQAENLRRRVPNQHARKTHCLRGHELIPENLLPVRSRRTRQCRLCAQERDKARSRRGRVQVRDRSYQAREAS